MAKVIPLGDGEQLAAFKEILHRAIQSSHLSFLVGSGASYPAVPPAGDIEGKITELHVKDDVVGANKLALTFLKTFADPMLSLTSLNPTGSVAETLKQYVRFVRAMDLVLSKRHSSLLPRQATVFTTNYDLFFEAASEHAPSILLNDGFKRVPSLTGDYELRSETFFDATLHTSANYDYKAELPAINLIKLHGSMSWDRSSDRIMHSLMDFEDLKAVSDDDADAVQTFLDKLAIILPTKGKFRETILDRTHYDLLRIFANVLDRENVIMIAFGFSFADEHILDIVKRALRNPTLLLVVCCYNPDEAKGLGKLFDGHHNVTLLIPQSKGDLNFKWLNDRLIEAVDRPKGQSDAI